MTKERHTCVMHTSHFLSLGAFAFEKIIYQHFSSPCDRRNTVPSLVILIIGGERNQTFDGSAILIVGLIFLSWSMNSARALGEMSTLS